MKHNKFLSKLGKGIAKIFGGAKKKGTPKPEEKSKITEEEGKSDAKNSNSNALFRHVGDFSGPPVPMFVSFSGKQQRKRHVNKAKFQKKAKLKRRRAA